MVSLALLLKNLAKFGKQKTLKCSSYLSHSSVRNISTLPERTYKESKLPVLKRDRLRLISMRFCPYAQRTRLVLEHMKIPYETYNVDLRAKPEWFFNLNPLGLVPVLQRNDEVIIESLICNDWLDANYPAAKGAELAARSQAESFRWKCLMAQVDSRVIPKFFSYIVSQIKQDPEATAKAEVFLQRLSWLQEQLGDQAYFAGNKVGLIDYNIYPWFERIADLELWNYPGLVGWRSRMQQLSSVKATMFDIPTHMKFFQLYVKAVQEEAPLNYDFDLEEGC